MEPTARGGNPQPANTAGHSGRKKRINWGVRAGKIEWFTLLVGSALLIAAVALFLGVSNNSSNSESKLVDGSKYQAVFLNGGVTSGSVLYSTYFGHITKLNNNYVVLNNVYYLTTDQTNQNNPQLTKLGCQQLHSPYDQMVINKSQVAFWENLKDDGKVVQAIKQFIQQNPNGPNCNATTNSTGSTNTGTQNTAGSTQNSTTTPSNKQ